MQTLSIPPQELSHLWTSVAALCFLAVPVLDADTVTLTPSKDSTIFSANSDATWSVGYIHAGRNGFDSKIFRSLMEFDITSEIPDGATIDSVTLTMYAVSSSNNFVKNSRGDLYRLEKEWSEGNRGNATRIRGISDGAPAQIGDATWILAEVTSDSSGLSGLEWNSPGGDFATTPSATTDYSSYLADLPGPNDGEDPSKYTPIVWTGPEMINDVQTWLDSPDTNHGWILRSIQAGSKLVFGSKETPANGTPAPTLVIEFTPGTVSDGDAIDDTWEQAIVDANPTDEIESIADVEPNGDFNQDGVSNILAYAFGYGPTEHVVRDSQTGYPILIPSEGDFLLGFTTLAAAANAGIRYIVDTRESLTTGSWSEGARYDSGGWTLQSGITAEETGSDSESTSWQIDTRAPLQAEFLRVRLLID